LGEANLQLGDVVAAQQGAGEEEQSLPELPARFAEAFESGGVDLAREGQAAGPLKGLDVGDGLGVKDVVSNLDRREIDRREAVFEFADPRTRIAEA
jgi:hypothetical protein